MLYDAWRKIPAWVINLDRRQDRWAQAQKEFDRLAWPVTRQAAVEAQPGWKGCLASHRAVWQYAITMNLPVVAVFEDDVVMPDDFIGIFGAAFKELPADWQFWQLHSSRAKYRPRGRYIAQILSRGWGTHGYLVTHDGCRQLLALPENKADSLVTEDFRVAGGKIYGVVPSYTLCFQRGNDSDIVETAQSGFWRRQLRAHAARFTTSAKQ
jgi:GR25 family glycosyltransferase involved in LPS biosynthesis